MKLRKPTPLVIYTYKGFKVTHPTDDDGNEKPFVYATKDGLTYQITINKHADNDGLIATVQAFIDNNVEVR